MGYQYIYPVRFDMKLEEVIVTVTNYWPFGINTETNIGKINQHEY